MALPTALLATTASLALGGAAVMSTVDVQRGSKRDNGSKSAIAAADAGANVAMMRLNRHAILLNNEKPCLKLNGKGEFEAGTAPASEPAWCAPVEGEVGDASYTYRVSAYNSGAGAVDVVSTGKANEVTRRIELSLDESNLWTGVTKEDLIKKELELAEKKGTSSSELKQLQEKLKKAQEEVSKSGGIAGLVGREGIVSSGNADIKVGVATNGNLTTSGNTSICGSIQVGIGKKWEKTGNASQCSGYSVTQGTMELPAVSSFMPSNIATQNSNGRITACAKKNPLPECQKDTYNGSWSSTDPFNPTNRSISLSGNTILTLGGSDYWVCSIQLSGNSKLIMAKGAHVRFFFDTPEHCGTSNQISMSGNNEITATGYQPSLGQFDVPGFYLLGSKTYASQVSLSGNSSTTNEFVIYAPESTINVSGNATFKGIIAGKQINWSGNGKIEQDKGFTIPPEITSKGGDETVVKTLEGETTNKEVEIKKLEEELLIIKQQLEGVSSGRTYNASAYVECSGGAVSSGQQPNAGC
ncbi:MAG TPA: hypothetical protein VFM94_09880 [Solirubrobacterales bacterium]|nr:hypothetical protein [Solirubrobacterales bacterium]